MFCASWRDSQLFTLVFPCRYHSVGGSDVSKGMKSTICAAVVLPSLTVRLALYCWLRHPGNFRLAVEEVIHLSGDTDSTAAIVGGISGATTGVSGIPQEWIDGILEWPRSVAWMRALASRLATQFPAHGGPEFRGPQPLFWPGLIPRNLLFLVIVLLHGFRRLLPPY